MTKNRKEFEAWANREINKIQKVLLLDSYRIAGVEPSNEPASYCLFRYPYKEIQIQYSEEVFKDWGSGKKAMARDILVHEMCHAVTDPLYTKAMARFVGKEEIEDEREQLTDHLANIVIKLTE